ncbi:hypothetical protein EVA_09841 [gut metagenome]|uniref:Uncharacterized protein n=1 Tax=gut metagenome TaxID=749906 RepID=J9CPM6_9ZZZZ
MVGGLKSLLYLDQLSHHRSYKTQTGFKKYNTSILFTSSFCSYLQCLFRMGVE